jgi:hypothetical protein
VFVAGPRRGAATAILVTVGLFHTSTGPQIGPDGLLKQHVGLWVIRKCAWAGLALNLCLDDQHFALHLICVITHLHITL